MCLCCVRRQVNREAAVDVINNPRFVFDALSRAQASAGLIQQTRLDLLRYKGARKLLLFHTGESIVELLEFVQRLGDAPLALLPPFLQLRVVPVVQSFRQLGAVQGSPLVMHLDALLNHPLKLLVLLLQFLHTEVHLFNLLPDALSLGAADLLQSLQVARLVRLGSKGDAVRAEYFLALDAEVAVLHGCVSLAHVAARL